VTRPKTKAKKRAARPATRRPSPLDVLIELLDGYSRLIADEWVMDGTSFEQDQHTRQAALAMGVAVLHLRSLRASLRQDERGVWPMKRRR
jgi:hypothetical protein